MGIVPMHMQALSLESIMGCSNPDAVSFEMYPLSG